MRAATFYSHLNSNLNSSFSAVSNVCLIESILVSKAALKLSNILFFCELALFYLNVLNDFICFVLSGLPSASCGGWSLPPFATAGAFAGGAAGFFGSFFPAPPADSSNAAVSLY